MHVYTAMKGHQKQPEHFIAYHGCCNDWIHRGIRRLAALLAQQLWRGLQTS
jgi:hypothetical protein